MFNVERTRKGINILTREIQVTNQKNIFSVKKKKKDSKALKLADQEPGRIYTTEKVFQQITLISFGKIAITDITLDQMDG